MKLLEKILVPTDFSQAGENVIATAVYVAKQFQSQICLLHVMPGTVDFCSDLQGMFRRKIDNHLEEIAQRIRAEGIEQVETVVERGVPFEQIERHAAERDVNVVIMGAGKSDDGGPGRLGTTAARIRRRTTKPVWVVKPDAAAQVQTILCPVDCSPSSACALENAIHLARQFRATLTVLTVLQGLPEYYGRFAPDAIVAEEECVREQLPQLDQFLEGFDFYDVRRDKLIRRGTPHREIVAVATEIRSDLLVMGTVGRTEISRILIGSVTRRVAQEMPCSIVTVKSEHAIRLRLDAEIANLAAQLALGHELLENGFPAEAVNQFQRCVTRDMMYAPAWEGMAAAHRRLGQHEEAVKCEKHAHDIVRHLWDMKIEAEIRGRHPVLGRHR